MFDPVKEKLLCYMELNDHIAEKLGLPPNAWWRGFVIEDRATGTVFARYRMKYDGGERHWYEIKSEDGKNEASKEVTMKALVKGLEMCVGFLVEKTGQLIGLNVDRQEAIRSWYPPDDNGDTNATIDWLIQQDLIEIKAVGKHSDLIKAGYDLAKADMIGSIDYKEH